MLHTLLNHGRKSHKKIQVWRNRAGQINISINKTKSSAMKTSWGISILFIILASFHFNGCSEDTDNEFKAVAQINFDTLTLEHSMKGWELYSWPNGNDWNYSLLPGTNRLKSYREVTENSIIVHGTDSLKMLLDKIPENENIFWISEDWLESIWGGKYGNLSLPDQKTINGIMDYCIQHNLVLTISG